MDKARQREAASHASRVSRLVIESSYRCSTGGVLDDDPLPQGTVVSTGKKYVAAKMDRNGKVWFFEPTEVTLTMHVAFPHPWKVERIPGGYKVLDAEGQSLTYVYGVADDPTIGHDSLPLGGSLYALHSLMPLHASQ